MATEDRVEGVKELRRKFENLTSKLQGKALASATNFAMTPVIKEARARIPVGVDAHVTHRGKLVAPGFAQRSIKKKTRQGRGKDRAFTFVGVEPQAFYAVQFVERGTVKQRPQPWLVPAFEAAQGQIEERIALKLKERIRKYSK